MATDVYRPCPCGSGKKLKFCCIDIIGEIEKIGSLQDNGQHHMALQALDRLESRSGLKKESRLWVLLNKASVHIQLEENEEAFGLLNKVLEEAPEHRLAIALRATAKYAADGFELAKPYVHEAFRKCFQIYPEIVSSLAMEIARLMHSQAAHMSAREHLALAMRFAPEADRQDVFVNLLQFDSNTDVPYPLRSVHQIKDYSGELEQEVKTATLTANLGCWQEAGKMFQDYVEKEPNNAALWYNLGLCRVLDGDEVRGAEALHKAASLFEDLGVAVECETIAQLLDQNNSENQVEVGSRSFKVADISRLISTLDENEPRIVRKQLPPQVDDEEELRPAAVFDILDQPPVENLEDLNNETIRNIISQIAIFDKRALKSDTSEAYVHGFKGDQIGQAVELLQQTAGDNLEEVDRSQEPREYEETIPSELFRLYWRWHYPQGTPMKKRRELDRSEWNHRLLEVWPNHPLSALGGKTPKEAASDPTLRVPLLGALYVVDSFCDRNRYHLDLHHLAGEIGIEALPPLEITEETHLQSFSAMQLHRLKVTELTDKQLSSTFNRALLLHHRRFLHEVLLEVLKRPACMESVDLNRVYIGLTELANERYDREEAFQWIEKGKEWAREQENHFEELFRWELRELTQRMEDPSDPQVQPLLKRFWNYYGTKLPQIRSYLQQLITTYHLEVPDNILTPDDLAEQSGQTTPGGLWTPGGEGSQPKKLWLPGQDK